MARVAIRGSEALPLTHAKKQTVAQEQAAERSVKFISSGSHMFDCVLGGGWAQGRVFNIVGDKSSGKTLLMIEAMINFSLASAPEDNRYGEAESAFDEDYARQLGMPDGIPFTDRMETVEEFNKDFVEWIERREKRKITTPALYALDSLDSLSDDKEMARDMGEGTYGTAKAKFMSEFFRRNVGRIQDSNVTLGVISQIRDKLNSVPFGETKTRSGGRALDFYASQIVWLAELKKITREVYGQKRVIGVEVEAKTKKNKVGPPFRQCVFPIYFSYGIDDEVAMLNFLKAGKQVDMQGYDVEDLRKQLMDARSRNDRKGVRGINRVLRDLTTIHWQKIEEVLKPSYAKYG